MSNNFTFNISLSILNHLGRNLYRNIITVIGEAISNSWDADANNVWIKIDRSNNYMIIKDDGIGMTKNDFQDKFLKIGYSKRKNGNISSKLNRPFIGRKGIGKLALLSCAKRIHIVSKVKGGDIVGGVIDNASLDKAITDDLNSQDYELEALNPSTYDHIIDFEQGTCIYFETLNNGIFNTIDYIKKLIALYFRFSLIDEQFSIYVNEELINEDVLSDLADNTQFLWNINDIKEPFFKKLNLESDVIKIKSPLNIKGYIASVKKPSNLKIRGTEEKVSIDIFVNGRLRERDILRYIPTTRLVESYVYGQIHYNDLDKGNTKDIFTSSREGIISDNPEFENFLVEFKKIFNTILSKWDDLRRQKGDDGDPYNSVITIKERKSEELINLVIQDMNKDMKNRKKDGLIDGWVIELRKEAKYNIPSYTECFVAENLLREFIRYNRLELTSEAKNEAEKWKKRERENKGKANISYDIRESLENSFYLDMTYLANFVDKSKDKTKEAALSRSAVLYKPLRDAIGHTSIITNTAKDQLSIEFENIKSRLAELLNELDK